MSDGNSSGNVVQEKSYAFALRIVRMYQHVRSQKQDSVLSMQVLRSGTSIGANVEEGLGAQSENDFFAKFSIAYKEARETRYWLRLMCDAGYLEPNAAKSLLADCDELLKIIGSIRKTIKAKKELRIKN